MSPPPPAPPAAAPPPPAGTWDAPRHSGPVERVSEPVAAPDRRSRESGGSYRPRPPARRVPLVPIVAGVIAIVIAGAAVVMLRGRGEGAQVVPPPDTARADPSTAVAVDSSAATPASIGVIVLEGELPPDAVIAVDGREVRGTSIRVTPGAHDIEIAAAGFAPYDETIAVGAGDTLRVEVALEPATASSITPAPGRAFLSLRAVPPHATITVEGREPAVGELSDESIPAGTPLHITITAPGYAPWDTTIVALPGASLQLGLRVLTAQP